MSELKVRPYSMLPSGQCYDRDEANKVIAEKDAEICRLQRALWLKRADDASSFASLFSTLGDIEDDIEEDESRTYYIFGNKRKTAIDKLKSHRVEIAYTWFRIWNNVADKCRKKAEEF